MDINATLIAQMITFILFVVFTMKVVWPPLMRVMEERRQKIADGLAAAEKGKRDLELAEIKVKEQLTEAKAEAARIIEQANQRANHIVEEAKQQAREEGDRLIQLAKGEVSQEYNNAKQQLLQQVSVIAVAGAEKILQREVDHKINDKFINEMLSEIS